MSATNTVVPFQIAIPDADLDDLHQRLRAARWPDELPDVAWDYGIPLQATQDLAARQP